MLNVKRIPPSVVKFICVGVISVAVDYGLLLLFYRVFGVPLEIATAAAYLIGLVVNFVLNRLWSFEVKKTDRRGTLRQVILYGLLVLVNIGLTIIVVGYAADHLNIPPEISKPIYVLFATVLNYVVYKKVIFK